MKAIRSTRYGDPAQVLELVDHPDPHVTAPDAVRVRVAAAGLNPYDWHLTAGVPLVARPMMGGLRPGDRGLGVDVAGVVEEVGAAVTAVSVGDRVFGMVGPEPGTAGGTRMAAVAEQVVVRERDLHAMPELLSFEEAAAVGIAGTTAVRALDGAGVSAGDRILVNGAAGGVGSFAVQLAADRGAEVIGVCSTTKLELVRGLGAERVVDYTDQDPTDTDLVGGPVDVVLDNVGNRGVREWLRVLTPTGRYVANFGSKQRRLTGPLAAMALLPLVDRFSSRSLTAVPSTTTREQFEALLPLLADGRLRPVVGHVLDLVDAPAAMQLIADGHARGKVVVRVQAT